ncbi:hypothetical protein C8R46DRAFT_269135 [Mycena filopes]|nr:hypothetical protein C8R46DRAFT_269135 [Mycena filopes]
MPMLREIQAAIAQFVRDADCGLYQFLALVRLYQSLLPAVEGDGDEITIVNETLASLKRIRARVTTIDPSSVPLYHAFQQHTKLPPACKTSIGDFGKRWPEAYLNDQRRTKLTKDAEKKRNQQKARAVTGVTVQVNISFDLAFSKASVDKFTCSAEDNLDLLLWLVNNYWTRSQKRGILPLNPYFYGDAELELSSGNTLSPNFYIEPQKFASLVRKDTTLLLCVDKMSYVWVPETKQRFGNLRKLDGSNSYLLKDAGGVLRHSVELEKKLGNVVHVKDRGSWEWQQLYAEWGELKPHQGGKFVVERKEPEPPAPDVSVNRPAIGQSEREKPQRKTQSQPGVGSGAPAANASVKQKGANQQPVTQVPGKGDGFFRRWGKKLGLVA